MLKTTDETPRYAPDVVTTLRGRQPVIRAIAHPAGQHPTNCPLIKDCVALELVTTAGSRWYGVERAWINSELRMVVKGFNARFEEMAAWQKVVS